MKEDSLLFNELFFRETFRWLADNPDKDWEDCPLWIFGNKNFYEEEMCYFPMVCHYAIEICLTDEKKKFLFPEARIILYRNRKAIQKRKCIMGVLYCVYCPIRWPVRKWTGGFTIVRSKASVLGYGLAKEKYYSPCSSNNLFGKGLIYKFYHTKNLRKKSEIAKQISELPLTELGERLVSGKYNNYTEVLMSYD